MNSISATDLLLIPELKHLTHFGIIDPANADLIMPFLKVLGCDSDYAVEIIPCQHRNMQGKVVVSYMLSWEIECNSSFLDSSFATTEDRIIAAGYKDVGLSTLMSSGQTSNRDYGNNPNDGFPPDLVNSDEKEIIGHIKQLADILLVARGNPHKNDGSLKLFNEAGVIEVCDKRRNKRVKLA